MCLAFIVHIFSALMGSSEWCRWDGTEEHSSSTSLKNEPSFPPHRGNFALLQIREHSQSHLRHQKILPIPPQDMPECWTVMLFRNKIFIWLQITSQREKCSFQAITFSGTHLPRQGKVEWDWLKYMPWEHFSCLLERIKDLSRLHLTWPSCVNLMHHILSCHMVMNACRVSQFMKLKSCWNWCFLCPSDLFSTQLFSTAFRLYFSVSLCSALRLTVQDQRALFSYSHLSQGLSWKNPGESQRPAQDSLCWLTDRREGAGQAEWRSV